jgi:uncharacterized spore protein YtfJ
MDMTDATDELVRQVSSIPHELGATACFGEPISREGHTLIPVARVNFGYGLGFGGGTDARTVPAEDGSSEETHTDSGGGGGGGGGGGSATPVAIIDVSATGVRIEPIEDKTRMALAGITMIAWNLFWALWTVRTLVRERSKIKRLQLEKD